MRQKRATRQPKKTTVTKSPLLKLKESPIAIVKEYDHTHTKRPITITPRSKNQQDLLRMLEDKSKYIVFATGPAGCGKSYLATLYAIKLLKEQKIDKIVITRPTVSCDNQDIGHLPGDIMEKMAPWILPIIDIFEEFYSKPQVKRMLLDGVIDVSPITYIRGRTFKNSYIILDEAQGTTNMTLKSILTRIGENSKIVVTGDINQSDRGTENGLSDFIRRISLYNPEGISIVKFDNKDIERHPIISTVLKMYGE